MHSIFLSLLSSTADFEVQLRKLIWRELSPNRFAAFCAALIGGFTILQSPALRLLKYHWLQSATGHDSVRKGIDIRCARFVSAFVAAWLSFQLLNSTKSPRKCLSLNKSDTKKNIEFDIGDDIQQLQDNTNDSKSISPLAGKTVGLTLFTITRAIDITIHDLWTRATLYRGSTRSSKGFAPSHTAASFGYWLSHLVDPAIFALSSGVVMWAWLYHPSSLPRTYRSWITDAAAIDRRLVEALRRARDGSFVYGVDTGQSPLLQDLCRDHDWPLEWADPAKTVPIPCEMVHMGMGPSCEGHALKRFAKAFRFAIVMYFPLNMLLRMPLLLPQLRRPRLGNVGKILNRILVDSARSASFLSSFIAIFYYSVCFTRTRLPQLFARLVSLFPSSTCLSSCVISPMALERGLAVAAGCAACGWSILFEAPSRRHEVAFFVAPKALVTLIPQRYDKRLIWREQLGFSVSAAVVLTYATEKPSKIRGVFGRLMEKVLAP